MAKKTASEEKQRKGAPSFWDEQVAHIRAKLLELILQGWTVRQVLADRAVWLGASACLFFGTSATFGRVVKTGLFF
jgi:hypothetical protein